MFEDYAYIASNQDKSKLNSDDGNYLCYLTSDNLQLAYVSYDIFMSISIKTPVLILCQGTEEICLTMFNTFYKSKVCLENISTGELKWINYYDWVTYFIMTAKGELELSKLFKKHYRVFSFNPEWRRPDIYLRHIIPVDRRKKIKISVNSIICNDASKLYTYSKQISVFDNIQVTHYTVSGNPFAAFIEILLENFNLTVPEFPFNRNIRQEYPEFSIYKPIPAIFNRDLFNTTNFLTFLEDVDGGDGFWQ